MKIDVLREFLYLSEELNYSATARHFFITQSALSRHIMDLETELGYQLFTRTKHSVRLTRAGKALANRSPDLIALHDSIISEIEHTMRQQDQSLTIGYLQGAAAPYLFAGKKLFKRDHPEIQVNVKSMQPEEIEEALRKDTIDVGITILSKTETPSLFARRDLYEDRFALMMDKRNPLAANDTIAPEALKKPLFVADSFPHQAQLASELREKLSQAGIAYKISENIDDMDSMPMLFEGKDWVCISCLHLERIFGEKFKFASLENVDLSYDVCLLWKKSRQSTVIQDLTDCIAYGYEIASKPYLLS